jgi:hypothetical protein
MTAAFALACLTCFNQNVAQSVTTCSTCPTCYNPACNPCKMQGKSNALLPARITAAIAFACPAGCCQLRSTTCSCMPQPLLGGVNITTYIPFLVCAVDDIALACSACHCQVYPTPRQPRATIFPSNFMSFGVKYSFFRLFPSANIDRLPSEQPCDSDGTNLHNPERDINLHATNQHSPSFILRICP